MLLVAQAWAEEPLVLPPITVQASPLDEYLPAHTQITHEELTESHKSELTDVLTLAPGINVRQGGRGEARVDMRGFDQRATLFTLNDVPVYEPYNGVINLDLFPLDMLGGVEIARGPSSALFGPNGMAGTVKLRSYAPTAPLTGAVSTIWRNDDFWDVRASGGGTYDKLTAVLGGRYLTTSGFPLPGEFDDRPPTRRRLEDGGTRLNSDREEKSGFGDFSYTLPDDGRVHATLLGSVASFGIPPSTTAFVPPPPAVPGTFVREDHEEFDHIQAGIDHRLGANAYGGAAVFYSAYTMRESSFTAPDFRTKELTTTTDSDEIGTIAHATIDVAERDSLALAAQIRRADADISDDVNGDLGRPHFTTSSLGFENVYFLTEWLRLIGGLSGDVQSGGGRGTVWEPDPQGGIAADLGPFGTARAGVARKIRFPTLRELFDPLQGNPQLRPEKALTYEIGDRLQLAQGYLDVSLFRSDVDDLIDMQGSGNDATSVNLDQAVLQGVEVVSGVTPLSRVRLDVNYTYLDAQARNGSSGPFSQIQHKPMHRFNGICRLFLPAEFLLRLEGLYSSQQLDMFGSNNNVDGFALFNLQLARSVGPYLDAFVGVDNVLDTDYEEKLGTPQPGRWAYVGLRAHYN